MVPRKSTAEEVSFEWSHHRISLVDLKIRTALHISITVSESEKVIKVCFSSAFTYARSCLVHLKPLCFCIKGAGF